MSGKPWHPAFFVDSVGSTIACVAAIGLRLSTAIGAGPHVMGDPMQSCTPIHPVGVPHFACDRKRSLR